MKKRYLFSTVAFLSLLTLCFPAATAQAVYEGGGAAIGTNVYVSKNNSVWDNYSNTNSISPTGQTLVVKPGDTIYFKGEVWNSADPVTGSSGDPLIIGLIKNAKYLENIDLFTGSNSDLDGNGIDFVALPPGPLVPTDEYTPIPLAFSDELAPKGPLGPNNVPESGTITATIKSDTPSGTVIEGILAYTFAPERTPNNYSQMVARPDMLTDIIDQMPEQGRVRLLVSTPQAALTLPATGASLNENHNLQILALTAFIGALVGISTVKIRKVVQEKAKK